MPYALDELARITKLLGRKSDDPLVECVVGIARSYKEQQRRLPNAHIVAMRDREREIALVAGDAAKLLGGLNKIYKQKNRHLQDALRLPARQLGDFDLTEHEMAILKLDGMLRLGMIGFVVDHLNKVAKSPTASKSGRKPNDAAVTALAALMVVWTRARGAKRGKDVFLRAALDPIGYKPGETSREDHLKAARALIRPR